ncbi:MAG: TPM domain-containing protein [Owenweeksia sp.]|nr:TPM domain-containing protein [Owenweeksia sp.]
MKKLLYLLPILFISLILHGQRFPERPTPPQLVNDFAEILSPEEEARLENKLVSYSDTTSTEIAVVIKKTLNDEDPNLYAAELGEAWGVGRKGKDNGLVFLVAVDDRKMAIQNGYGLEPILTDAATKIIIEEYIIPAFKKGNYYQGIEAGTNQIINLLQGQFKGSGNRQSEGKRSFPFIALIIMAILIFTFVGRRRSRSGYRGGGAYWIGGMGGGMGGSSGGFGGGGGFGGFGGGSFGGGGASGSW